MVLDPVLGDAELLGDLAVGQSRGDQAGDFALTIGECVGHVASLWPRGAIRAAGPGAVGQAAIE